MPELAETIYAPELAGGDWINGQAVKLKELRGHQVALIDFWDYTCVNCIRTLPYVAQWQQRYADSGLLVVGVHAPEFSFARDAGLVARAVQSFNLQYPVVLDNDYAIWRAYSNRYWPAKYLIDAQGRIRYYHFGEGGYGETERVIQRLLLELHPDAQLPPVLEPLRDTDVPGAVCYRVTPELYLGYSRGQFGNPQGIVKDRAHEYRDMGRYAEGFVYISGGWKVEAEAACAAAPGAKITLRYTAREANLVLAPGSGGASRMEVRLSENQHPGADVQRIDGKLMLTIDRARMFNLVANDEVDSGSLELVALDPGISAYAFTFTSSCVQTA